MEDLEILMLDGCTRSEAKEHLEKGTTIFDHEDLSRHFSEYMEEWDIEEDEQEPFRRMIEEQEPAPDWGVVEHNGHIYYIQYVL